MAFSDTRCWNAHWISIGSVMVDWTAKDYPAPCFRKEFELSHVKNSLLYICGLGYHEVWINGERVGDYELAPAPAKYDSHAGYIVHDVSQYLQSGRNTIGVMLGNGFYNCQTAETWHFDKATWRDYPKMLLELTSDGKTVLASDDSWKVTTSGPIIFNAVRNGEYYDARLEMPGWNRNGFDDSNWNKASVTAGPGGILYEQTSPPCRVTNIFPMHKLNDITWDAGQNIAGRAEIAVRGKRGSSIKIQYSDMLDQDGSIKMDAISPYVKSGEFQTERYTLKGIGTEIWHSRFTYHGFRYAAVETSGEVEIVSMTAQAIHSDVKQIGDFTCSDPVMNALKKCTYWSYLNNLIGIPTDCPHREKNGWLNDTQLASDTGLFFFDGKETYREWLGTIRDCMRPNGQLPGMAPTSGWGYNWGNGPMFDEILLGIPRRIYIYRGDTVPMRENYEPFKKVLAFSEQMAQNHIIRHGLGDWKHPFKDRAVDPALTVTAWHYHNLKILIETAKLFGYEEDVKRYTEQAKQVFEAFNREFSNGNGSYANNEKTALAVAVHFGFCKGKDAINAVRMLVEDVRKDGHIADFGIVGAKFVPRVLAEYGYADDGLKIFTQDQYPGWGRWIRTGETTLCEDFAGKESHDHIMYGDLFAWMMQYAAGIEPSFERPGFREVVLKPRAIASLNDLSASYETIYGTIRIDWKRTGGEIRFHAEIPEKIPGRLELPDGTVIAIQKEIKTHWKG